MTQTLLLLAVFGLAYTGFAWLALSQKRHWRCVRATGSPIPGQILALRVMGASALGLSLWLALLRDGPSFGALLWVTAICVTALAVAFTLSGRPRWLRAFAWPVARPVKMWSPGKA